MLVFFVLFCFLGPLIYQTNQSIFNPLITDLAPGGGHLLGTDEHGFDELGRIMAGGQTALEIGFFASFIATVIGTLWGAIAGLAGGIVDGDHDAVRRRPAVDPVAVRRAGAGDEVQRDGGRAEPAASACSRG